ncbi:VgrG-related protein [Allostreptomyces psammosilenae]|uniref:Uncharacterized protein involved in type VI secretion and phage assembly n=1 Tax=Allostreptomyces psammosilenae TaxID=1892865 RepID=A0A852ZQ71_9ACTN|nr:VgrG-related protein [Allostreptomyces psammosilenae]NYI03895.1 uncharacterized protein involved in type VI secretion and phage assembly [Allostreptomyces psammosilenae]
MPKPSVAKALVVEVGGRQLTGDVANAMVEGYVDDSRTLPDVFLLRFRDPGRVVLDKGGFKIGVEVRLLAGTGDDQAPQPLLTGEVTALEVEIDDTGTFTVVRGMDAAHRLFRGRRVASYQNMTVSDICRAVAQRAGLRPGKVNVPGPVLEHVAQPGVSDWEFLHGLAEEAGAQAYVRDGQLHVTMPTAASGAPDASTRSAQSPLVLEMGVNLLRCRAGVTAAEQVKTVEVRGWDVHTKRALVGQADAGRADTLQLPLTPAEVSAPFGKASYVVTDTPYTEQAQVDQAAKALAQRIAGSFAELEAVIRGNPRVRSGTAVALSGVGAPFEGRYTVTSARQVFDSRRGYETWITVSGHQERSLFGLTAGGTGPATVRGAGPRWPGLVSGTVTDTKDPERLGRVKVRFPWLSDDYASDWARTAQFAGASGQEAFVPEVGEEVLVGFEQGHLDRPYVLAGLYNGKDRPTREGGELIDRTSGVVNRRSFALHGRDRVELHDAATGARGVRLLSGDGKLTINLDRSATSIVVHSDGTVEIDATDRVTVKAGSGVRVDAGNGPLDLSGESVSVTARTGVQVDGGSGQLKLSTGGAVDVKGAQVAVNGTGRTEIKGGASCSISAPMVRIN